MHVVSDLSLVAILQAQALLVQLAYAIHTLADIVVVDEGFGSLICCELEKQDGVAFVLNGIGGGRIDDLSALLLLDGLLHFCRSFASSSGKFDLQS